MGVNVGVSTGNGCWCRHRWQCRVLEVPFVGFFDQKMGFEIAM